MPSINFLTSGFSNPNSRALVIPLMTYANELKENCVDIKFYYDIHPEIYNCETLLIDNRFFINYWEKRYDEVMEHLKNFRNNINKIIYFDTMDSSAWISPQVLPYVDSYLKNQILKEKKLYQKKLYGFRLHTDYYHKEFNINDSEPGYSKTIIDEKLLDKIKVGWNSGLADYSVDGPIRMRLYHKWNMNSLLRKSRWSFDPKRIRKNKLSCRMETNYSRETVKFQRKKVSHILGINSQRVNRISYFREMMNSKMTISPFGWGEINYKDYEVFLSGGLLLKPNMNHLETWPDLYQDNKTYCSFNWDFSDLLDKVEHISSHYSDYQEKAIEGQKNYLSYFGKEGSEKFINRFCKLIRDQT